MLLSIVHAPFGIEVLKRNIIFIDLATAQFIGLMLVAVGFWFHEPSWGITQVICFSAAVLIALFFWWIEKTVPKEQEAVIGSVFILAASIALILLADNPHGGDELEHILSGQLLFVNWIDILTFLPLYVVVGIVWMMFPQCRTGVSFFILFTMTITASVQLVGVYVVFASLILPALASWSGSEYKLLRAVVSGSIAVVIAIVFSAFQDLPAGPVLVVCFALTAIVARLLIHFRLRLEPSKA